VQEADWAAGGAGGPKAYLAHLALAACEFIAPPSVTNTTPLACFTSLLIQGRIKKEFSYLDSTQLPANS